MRFLGRTENVGVITQDKVGEVFLPCNFAWYVSWVIVVQRICIEKLYRGNITGFTSEQDSCVKR